MICSKYPEINESRTQKQLLLSRTTGSLPVTNQQNSRSASIFKNLHLKLLLFHTSLSAGQAVRRTHLNRRFISSIDIVTKVGFSSGS